MVRLTTTAAVVAAALAGVPIAGNGHAQPTPPASVPAASAPDTTKAKQSDRVTARKAMAEKRTKKKADPSVWDKTKDMTRAQWSKAKGAWAREKGKWRDCNARAKAEKLSGTKRWTSIGSCMTS